MTRAEAGYVLVDDFESLGSAEYYAGGAESTEHVYEARVYRDQASAVRALITDAREWAMERSATIRRITTTVDGE